MKFILLSLFCVFTLIGFDISQAMAAQKVGKVELLQGRASVAADIPKKLSQGDAVYMGDVIETGISTRARLEFVDGTKVTLGENAAFRVDDFIYERGSPAKNKGRFSVLRGAFLFVSGLISKNDHPDVRVDTAYGSLGIRGTTFWGGLLDRASMYEDDRQAGRKEEFGLYVQKGTVALMTNRGEALVEEGYGSFTRSKNTIPSTPKVWSAVDIEMALKQTEISE